VGVLCVNTDWIMGLVVNAGNDTKVREGGREEGKEGGVLCITLTGLWD